MTGYTGFKPRIVKEEANLMAMKPYPVVIEERVPGYTGYVPGAKHKI
jgi:hypothetical protein